jgi:hypothetical protein
LLESSLGYSDGSKGGWPPYDAVAMFKVLILASQNTVSDARMEFLIRDRLSWTRFLGFELGKTSLTSARRGRSAPIRFVVSASA